MNRAEKLMAAATLIMEVQSDLDLHHHQCDTCGHKVFKDWNDFQANSQLEATLNRIYKWIKIFEKDQS